MLCMLRLKERRVVDPVEEAKAYTLIELPRDRRVVRAIMWAREWGIMLKNGEAITRLMPDEEKDAVIVAVGLGDRNLVLEIIAPYEWSGRGVWDPLG